MLEHLITFKCDICGTEFQINEDFELPPGWIGSQITIANSQGYIVNQEREVYSHFCSRECFSEYIGGEQFSLRLALVDRPIDPDDNNDEGEDPASLA